MMLLLRLAVLITFGLSCAVALATDSNNVVKSNPTIKDTQALRFLRRYAFDEEANRENEDEERGIGVSKQLDDVLLKADEVIGISKNVVRKVGGALIKNSRETDEYLRLTRALSGKYPTAKELGLSTLRQLKKIEAVRKKDIEKGIDVSKAATDGMHRDIKLVDGIKRVPDKYMGAHVGRDQQRFTEADTRSLAAGVVTRTNKKGEQKILLEKDESVEMAALREVIEEGGVKANILHDLGTFELKDGKVAKAFLMKSDTIYDDWAESLRYRLWVSYDDAIKLLKNCEQMVAMVKKAKAMAKTDPNPNFSKFKLDIK
ncbi:hypothetical protein GN244_ATG11512 [Phytophthora infestans]|uniref:RxLR effector protein n=1 Tax=Phytophthora infestans TaxID=4787 RepID=A0A833RZQ7_PHYIN|nr:hypothetical protein GN244_ATG11512 [Phytophthora infestans]